MDNEKNNPAPDNAAENAPEILDFTETEADTAGEVIDLTETGCAEEATEQASEAFEEAAETVVTEEVPAAETAAEEAKEAAAENEPEPTETEEKPEEKKKEKSAENSEFRPELLGKIIVWVVAAVIFISAVYTTVYYVTTASKSEFHADCTDTIMWAEASVESGHVYDQNFKYACFLPFGTSTLMIPLIKLFGFGLKAHIWGMMGFFILLTVFMVLMIKEVSGSFPAGLAGTGLFLSVTLASEKMREIFWGHTIYYSLGLLFLVIGTYLYARFLAAESSRKKRRKNGRKSKVALLHKLLLFVCLCLFLLLTGTDGITGFTLFAIPFAGAVFAEQFINGRNRLLSMNILKAAFRAVMFLVMAAAGNIINNKLVGDLKASYQDANSEFSAMGTWQEHFQKLPFAWIKLLGVKDTPDVMFTDKKGIPNLIFIVAAVLLAALPIVATCCYKKYGSDRRGRLMRMWVWIHWAVTAVVLMGYICGILAAADWRIVPMIGTALILSISFVLWTVTEKSDTSRIAVLLMIPVIAAGVLSCKEVLKIKKDAYKNNVQYQLADFIRKSGVNRGYATFWNANSITLLTDGKVKVSDVIVSDSGVTKRAYQSSTKWYEDVPGQEEYFLLLSQYEYDLFASSDKYQNDTPYRKMETTINNIGYVLLVYNHNFV